MKDARIEAIWNAIEDADPDISTERLMAMTCEQVSQETGRDYDAGDVSAALYRRQTARDKREKP